MRRFLNSLFVIFLCASIFLVIISFYNKEWQTIATSIYLIIAIVSVWIAYEVFYRKSQTETH